MSVGAELCARAEFSAEAELTVAAELTVGAELSKRAELIVEAEFSVSAELSVVAQFGFRFDFCSYITKFSSDKKVLTRSCYTTLCWYQELEAKDL